MPIFHLRSLPRHRLPDEDILYYIGIAAKVSFGVPGYITVGTPIHAYAATIVLVC